MEIASKVAVVTGAGGDGCRRAIARRLARYGAGVVVSDVDEVAAAVARLASDEWSEDSPRLIPWCDPGYVALTALADSVTEGP